MTTIGGILGESIPLYNKKMATITLKRTGQQTVYNALKAGYRLLDGAGDYGNEREAGEGLARAIKDGVLWNTFHAPEHVAKLARLQLQHWQLDYFDLFHIHFPIALKYVDPEHRYPPEWFADDGSATWQAMEKLADEGLAKNIGVSNFNGSLLLDVLRYARIPPAVLQIEHHPYLVQQPLLDLAKSRDIAVTAYCSFGPASW
ncbi:3331_t:CDS:2, partial [Acaulospora colombiana]